jgi:hypothetical protein
MQAKAMSQFLVAALAATTMSVAFAQADNSNSKVSPKGNFSNWMMEQSKTNQGRISRDAYMQEAGRRWDELDRNRQGLTVHQLNEVYGYAPAPATPAATRDTTPGSMSPSNVKR